MATAKGFGRVEEAHHDNTVAVRDVSTHTTARGMAPYAATALGGRVQLLEQADRENFEPGAHMFRFIECKGGIPPLVTVRWKGDHKTGYYCTVLESDERYTNQVDTDDESDGADANDGDADQPSVQTRTDTNQTTLEQAFQHGHSHDTGGEIGTDTLAAPAPAGADEENTDRGGAPSATMPAEPTPERVADGWALSADAILPAPSPDAHNWAAPAVQSRRRRLGHHSGTDGRRRLGRHSDTCQQPHRGGWEHKQPAGPRR